MGKRRLGVGREGGGGGGEWGILLYPWNAFSPWAFHPSLVEECWRGLHHYWPQPLSSCYRRQIHPRSPSFPPSSPSCSPAGDLQCWTSFTACNHGNMSYNITDVGTVKERGLILRDVIIMTFIQHVLMKNRYGFS